MYVYITIYTLYFPVLFYMHIYREKRSFMYLQMLPFLTLLLYYTLSKETHYLGC